MPYYDGDETREEREERHRISQKRIAADNQALTEASGHLIGRLVLIPFKCILKLTLWSSRHAWQYGWRLAQRLYFSQRTHSGRRFNVIDNFKMCMRHSFRWKGRASRKEFWHFVGTGTVMYMVVGALGQAMQSSMPQSSISALVQPGVDHCAAASGPRGHGAKAPRSRKQCAVGSRSGHDLVAGVGRNPRHGSVLRSKHGLRRRTDDTARSGGRIHPGGDRRDRTVDHGAGDDAAQKRSERQRLWARIVGGGGARRTAGTPGRAGPSRRRTRPEKPTSTSSRRTLTRRCAGVAAGESAG